MAEIHFEVPGIPRGQGRPRFARRGKFVKTYKESKDVETEGQISFWFLQTVGADFTPLDCPIELVVDAYFPCPKSLLRKVEKSVLGVPHCVKPDTSNIIKAVEDALNGIAWKDDARIWRVSGSKYYCSGGKPPRIKVWIQTKGE